MLYNCADFTKYIDGFFARGGAFNCRDDVFTLGVELSMTPMGERVGTCMTRSKKLSVMVLLSFILGIVITISEPDLQVLAEQVPSIPNLTLILQLHLGSESFL